MCLFFIILYNISYCYTIRFYYYMILLYYILCIVHTCVYIMYVYMCIFLPPFIVLCIYVYGCNMHMPYATKSRPHRGTRQHVSLPLQLALQRCSRVLNLALHSWTEARYHCMDKQVLVAFDARCRHSQCAHYDRNACD